MKRCFEIIFFIVFFNLCLSFVISGRLGGTTLNGKVEHGRYYLGSHGHYTEVTSTTFRYCQYYEVITFSSALCIVGGMAIYFFFINNWKDITSFFARGRDKVMHVLTRGIQQIISFMITPFFHRNILCNHCWCYTDPFQSQYQNGKRFCEHCQQEVEHTKMKGKVIFMFGTFSVNIDDKEYTITTPRFEVLKLPNRVVVLSNPGFKAPQHRIDVSEIYIDTKTCHSQHLERGITYICHYLPDKSVNTIQLFYRGNLDDLGEHLKNTLHNTFQHIEEIHTT